MFITDIVIIIIIIIIIITITVAIIMYYCNAEKTLWGVFCGPPGMNPRMTGPRGPAMGPGPGMGPMGPAAYGPGMRGPPPNSIGPGPGGPGGPGPGGPGPANELLIILAWNLRWHDDVPPEAKRQNGFQPLLIFR
ncbi:hypothetical protein E2C01_008073 [Portunus trituberculatus]|uniref:Uncharacterized protein n=1 Tax=Portunus trituberculatus TaxID=210409 RepID=A0A5B7CZU6_PORTR|nr:hypothetical protein [Portunus trituberculatus]